MPKVLAYLPCEKIVVEQGSQNVSVMAILETLAVAVPPNVPPPPPGTVIPMQWTIFTLLQKEDGDRGDFESRSVFMSPSGEQLIETSIAKWNLGSTDRHQVVDTIVGFPIWTPGKCKLKLMLKKAAESEFRELINTTVNLKHGAP